MPDPTGPEPFSPPPPDAPVIVRPNRHAPAGPVRKTLGLVLLVTAGILAVVRTGGGFGPDPTPGGFPLAWFVPVGVYGAVGVGMVVLRGRLPARVRTWELRERQAAPTAAPTPEPKRPIDLHFDGTDGSRPVRLDVDERGFRWQTPPGRLAPATELHIPWEELEGIAATHLLGPTMVPGLVVIGIALGIARWQPVVGTMTGLAGFGLVGLRGWRRRGILSLLTATHTLQFQSTALDPEAREQVMAAARARSPRTVPGPVSPGPGALRSLFVEPLLDLVRACRSDGWVRARLLQHGSRFGDEEMAVTAVIQWRLYGLWNGLLRGLGPLSCAVGAGLGSGSGLAAVIGWLIAWVAGLYVVTQSMTAFARFSGMEVIRPAALGGV